MEISRITKFIIQRGATVNVEVTGQHYRWSPLMQGGMEVPYRVFVKMPGTILNHTLLQCYQELLNDL